MLKKLIYLISNNRFFYTRFDLKSIGERRNVIQQIWWENKREERGGEGKKREEYITNSTIDIDRWRRIIIVCKVWIH